MSQCLRSSPLPPPAFFLQNRGCAIAAAPNSQNSAAKSYEFVPDAHGLGAKPIGFAPDSYVSGAKSYGFASDSYVFVANSYESGAHLNGLAANSYELGAISFVSGLAAHAIGSGARGDVIASAGAIWAEKKAAGILPAGVGAAIAGTASGIIKVYVPWPWKALYIPLAAYSAYDAYSTVRAAADVVAVDRAAFQASKLYGDCDHIIPEVPVWGF